MRFIMSIIKNIIAIVAIIAIVLIALKYAPFLKDQDWNPISHDTPSIVQQDNTPELQGGKRYEVEKNDLLNNIPLGQTKNVFNLIDKKEFMSVTGFKRMGYNDQYLIGQRDEQFIIYKFGSDKMRVYATEIEMKEDLKQLGQDIPLKSSEAFE
ncbi:DUF4930 family protein [Staphylococcus sp. SQ8-PEA]|uniref:DUF4930 family protein n=1 Tax=Staphylococcus marylandisciuri TaxID=2981529 RepID=A0ABT2QQ22_9STAP|nr:DUF4930 family protein [Staphylococcus marylandisciuri]MCU5746063.1 DUF4930 family protein [Staphylococcus marylandisciuri]